jgi:hypothetical protein
VVPCEAEEDAALGGRSIWRKRGSLEVAVGDWGGLAVGGWCVSSVVAVADGVGVARGTRPWERGD